MGIAIWVCHDCGDCGMTTFVNTCPSCGHIFCYLCHTEAKLKCYQGNAYYEQFYLATTQYELPKRYRVPNKLPPQSTSKDPLSFFSPTSSTPQKGSRGLESHASDEAKSLTSEDTEHPVSDEGITPLLSAKTPNLIMASDIGQPSRYSALSSEDTPTPVSTKESNIPSGPFSHQDYVDSETEFGTDDTKSTDDMTDDEDTMEAYEYMIDILDSHLFSILGHDFELASRLIPVIHAQLQFVFGRETRAYITSPSHGSDGTPEANGDFSASTLIPGNGSSNNSSPGNKHGRDRDESKDREDKSSPKKPRIFRDRNTDTRPRYACHFYKKDPARSWPPNSSNFKFKTCLGLGNPELRRMKEHYKKAHRPPQCEKCYIIFKDHDKLKVHRQAEPSCRKQPDISKGGIDDSQWEKIEPLFRVRRTLSPSQKKRDDYDKWFEIWNILFPDVPQPPDPWDRPAPVTPNASISNIEGFLTAFNSAIELEIERGVFQLGDELLQHIERILRLTFQTHAAASVPATSFNRSFPEVIEPGHGSAENPSERNTAVESLEISLGQHTSLQPMQHSPGLYQDHTALGLEDQSVPSFSEQFNLLEDIYTSQSSNESMPQVSNVQDTSIVFESLIGLRETLTTQEDFAVSSSSHYQSEVVSSSPEPAGHLGVSDTEWSQDFWGFGGRSEYAEDSRYRPRQDGLLPLDADDDFVLDEELLDSDWLTNVLESENNG